MSLGESSIMISMTAYWQQQKEPNKTSLQSNPIEDLEQSIKGLEQRIGSLTQKIEFIMKKLSTFSQAKQKHVQLTHEWKNKWFITRTFYQFISFFYEVPEIKTLKKAKEELIQAEEELNKELPHNTPHSYIEKLLKLQKRLKQEHKKFENIILLNEIQQKKQGAEVAVKPHHEEAYLKAEPDQHQSPSFLHTVFGSDYYGFFKKHLPGRYTLQAIAVGAAAIAIKNLGMSE